MKCPICAQELDAEAKFCARCGKKIPRCPICGTVFYERSRFCPVDGTPLPSDLFADFPPAGGEEQVAAGISAVVAEALGEARQSAPPAPEPVRRGPEPGVPSAPKQPPKTTQPQKAKPKPAPKPPALPNEKKKSHTGVIVAVVLTVLLLVLLVLGGTYYVLKNGLPSFLGGADISSSEDDRRDDGDDSDDRSSKKDEEDKEDEFVQDALVEAEDYVVDGEYGLALQTILDALKEYPRSRELKDAREEYEALYTEDLIVQVDHLIAERNYDQARRKLDEGLALLPDHGGLLSELEALEEAIAQENSVSPVSMSGLVSIDASSYLSEPGLDLYHTPERTVDGDLATAWVEGVDGNGIGESITFGFDKVYLVSGIRIHAGYQKSAELYTMNNRPAMLTVTFSDGTEQVVQLQDINGVQDVPLYYPVETESIRLTISSVYGGTTYEDTVISELSFY